MSDGERYHSIPERIAWTSGFRLPVDAFVLGKLSMFASFKTGLRARMRLDKLVAQCAPLSRSTVLRALQRLEADGFIKAWRQHRRPTVYDICVERLAPDWRGVKLLNRTTSDFAKPPLSVTSDTQESLRVTGERLSVTGDTQEAVLSVTGDTPSPVRTDPQSDHEGTGTSAQQLSFPPLDVGPEAPRFDADALRAQLAALPPLEATGRRKARG